MRTRFQPIGFPKNSVRREIDRTSVRFTVENHNGRPYLVGIDDRGDRFDISPKHHRPHRKTGPNGRPVVCLRVFTYFQQQNHLMCVSTLDQKGIVELLPCQRNGFDIDGQGRRKPSHDGDYIMAEIAHPKLLAA